MFKLLQVPGSEDEWLYYTRIPEKVGLPHVLWTENMWLLKTEIPLSRDDPFWIDLRARQHSAFTLCGRARTLLPAAIAVNRRQAQQFATSSLISFITSLSHLNVGLPTFLFLSGLHQTTCLVVYSVYGEILLLRWLITDYYKYVCARAMRVCKLIYSVTDTRTH